jgi:1-acyl-sn-glycerol-3-phosphate acyltransferase
MLAAEWRRLRRPTITIRVGEPFQLPPARGRGRKQRLTDDTDFIMCRIAELLPARYRGAYAAHPYLLAKPKATLLTAEERR